MGAHAPGQIHAVGVVADRHHTAAEERAKRHRSQPQGAQPNHRDVLARPELRFVVAVGAERIEMRVHGIFIGNVRRRFHHARAVGGDVFRLVGLPCDDAVAHLHTGDGAADAAHDAEVAVAYPARVVGRAGHALGPLVVAAIGADLQRGDARLDPDVVRLQVAGVQGLLFDAQIARAAQHGDFHDAPPNSYAASSMAMMFSAGTFGWMLWTWLKT